MVVPPDTERRNNANVKMSNRKRNKVGHHLFLVINDYTRCVVVSFWVILRLNYRNRKYHKKFAKSKYAVVALNVSNEWAQI